MMRKASLLLTAFCVLSLPILVQADSIADSYKDETKIAIKDSVEVDTAAGQVKLERRGVGVTLDSSTVGFWRFNEDSGTTAEDSSYYDNDGTLYNFDSPSSDTSGWCTGRHGNALVFDGIDDYVGVPDDASLDITDSITLETWINTSFSGDADYNFGILDKGVYGLFLDRSDGKLKFSLNDTTTPSWSLSYDISDCIYSLAVYDGKLYAGSSIFGKIYVYDGDSWSLAYDSPAGTVKSLAVYDGKLYAGTSSSGIIYVYDGSSWSESYDSPASYIHSLAVYKGKLYAGSDNSGRIYVYDGSSWSENYDSPASYIYSLAVYDGELYAGTGIFGKIYVYDGSSWSESYDASAGSIYSLAVYDGELYAGSGTGGVIYSYDGSSWGTSYDSPASYVYSLCVYNGELYAGTGSSGIIYSYDGSSWSENEDSDESNVYCLAVYDGQLYCGNGNGGQIYAYGESEVLASTKNSWSGWHHVAATYDGTVMKMFVDGDSTDAESASITISASSMDLFIGKTYGSQMAGGSGEFLKGKLDEVRIFDRALTADEIENEFHANSYYSCGTLTSINFLPTVHDASVNTFGYNASDIPSSTTLRVQFSQNESNWYSSDSTSSGWDTLSEGTSSLSLWGSGKLNWTLPDFYYKAQLLTSTWDSTSILDSMIVVYGDTIPVPPDWQIQMKVFSDTACDTFSYAGMKSDALDEYDSYDLPKAPPPPSPYVRVYFPHPEWNHPVGEKFLKDVREPRYLHDATMMWEFEINSDHDDTTDIEIQLDITEVPDSFGVYVMDMETGDLQDMRICTVLTYLSVDVVVRKFQLVVGKPERDIFSGWSLISVPVLPDEPDPASIFLDWGLYYYLYGFTPASGYITPDSVRIGHGYWLGVEQERTLSDIEGTYPGATDTITVPLEEGWNLIGDPFLTDINLDSTQVQRGDTVRTLQQAADSGWVNDVLYTYTPATNEYTSPDYLSAWTGYWFSGLVDDLELLIHKATGAKEEGSESPIAIATVDSWSLIIPVSCAQARDEITYLGVAPDATDGPEGKYDYPEPPTPPTNWAIAYFSHPEWGMPTGNRFNADIRAPIEAGEEKTWIISVTSNVPDQDVTVSWPGIAELPEYLSFTIKDLESLEETDMRDQTSTAFRTNSSGTTTRRFEIAVSNTQGVETGPGKHVFALHQNKPNPFVNRTTIAYSVPKATNATLALYDLSGRLVSTLVDKELKAGKYETSLDSKSLTSGIYFVKFNAGEDKAMKKVILLQ